MAAFGSLQWPAVICHKLNFNLAKTCEFQVTDGVIASLYFSFIKSNRFSPEKDFNVVLTYWVRFVQGER